VRTDEYAQLPPEEKEHFLQCRECDEWLDRRSLDEVLFYFVDHKHRPTKASKLEAPRRRKHVLPTSFYGNGGTKFQNKASG
jgi:hypothetical protein